MVFSPKMSQSIAILALALTVTATQALAKDLPPAVKSEVATDIDACKASGGTPASTMSAIQTADANQDGQLDYVLDEGKLCEVGFCGSGGCSFVLFLSGPEGVKKSFSGLGMSPKISAGMLMYKNASGRTKVKISGYSATE
jgi:hypothetical protein